MSALAAVVGGLLLAAPASASSIVFEQTTVPLGALGGSGFGNGIALGDFNDDDDLDYATVVRDANTSNPGRIVVRLNDGAGGFGDAHVKTVGTFPGDLAVADFNGDSIADLVTANRNSDNLSLLFGNGDGTFDDHDLIAIGAGNEDPAKVEAVDVNDDGKADLVIGNDSGSIAVRLGNGNGTFGAPVTYADFGAANLVMDDFDGDGSPDIVTANWLAGVDLRLNDGTGDFESVTSVTGAGAFPNPVGDVTGDSNADLGLIYSSSWGILEGDGTGGFSEGATFEGAGAGGLAAADLDDDGDRDLMLVKSGLETFEGDGDGGFTPNVAHELAIIPMEPVAGDLNGDGLVDVVVGGQNGVAVLLNTTGETDPPETTIESGPEGLTNETMPTFTFSADEPGATFECSFDQGTPEFEPCASGVQFGPHWDGTFTFRVRAVDLSGNIDPTPATRELTINAPSFADPVTVPVDTPRGLALADMNGDGNLDAVTSFGSVISVHLGDGNAGLGAGDTYPAPGEVNSNALAVADLDDNGTDDVVVGFNNSEGDIEEGIAVLPGVGDGTLEPAATVKSVESVFGIATGEVDDEDGLDVVATSSINGEGVKLLSGDGSGDLGDPTTVGLEDRSNLQGVAVGDLNEDGVTDIVATARQSDTVSVLAGEGGGEFAAGDHHSVSQPVRVEIAEIAGDQAPDFVVGGFDGFTIFEGIEPGPFEPMALPSSGDGLAIAVADFDIDGIPDVLASEGLHLGAGGGQFTVPTLLSLGETISWARAGDLNDDDVPDLVVATNTGITALENTIAERLVDPNPSACEAALAKLSAAKQKRAKMKAKAKRAAKALKRARKSGKAAKVRKARKRKARAKTKLQRAKSAVKKAQASVANAC